MTARFTFPLLSADLTTNNRRMEKVLQTQEDTAQSVKADIGSIDVVRYACVACRRPPFTAPSESETMFCSSTSSTQVYTPGQITQRGNLPRWKTQSVSKAAAYEFLSLDQKQYYQYIKMDTTHER